MNNHYVADARKAAKITQAEMAEYLNMVQSTYSSKEQHNRFTALELSKIEQRVGSALFNEAKLLRTQNVLNEGPTEHGEAGSNYRQTLKLVKEILDLHHTSLLIQAEIYAELKNKPVSAAISDIRTIYKQKTGKGLNF